MFERMMRFESNLRYGFVDWVLGLLLFYLIYLFSFFHEQVQSETRLRSEEKCEENNRKGKKNRPAKRPAER